MSFGARARICLDALDHNLQIIRQRAPGARLMAVIKANAYGHGMLAVARRLTDADSLAVARFSEAVELRKAGIDKPLVVLVGAANEVELLTAGDEGLEIVVHTEEQLDCLLASNARNLTVWLKFDTGMNRLGFSVEDKDAVLAAARRAASVSELRLMTHLSTADDLDSPVTGEQLKRFRPVAAGFDGAVSIANSAAVFGGDAVLEAQAEFAGEHWIRPGVALFGISPLPGHSAAQLGLKPVMQFEAPLIAVKPLVAGSRVGYRGRYVADKDTTLGVVAAGYGDGYSRHFRDGTPVVINGRRAALIGIVSMDLLAVDLGPNAVDKPGDIVTLWGDTLPVEEAAPWADAIPYDLVCGVTHRGRDVNNAARKRRTPF